jgi:RimJ/RimL family protein N-acetyltransferase
MITYGLGVYFDTLERNDLELLRAWRNDYSIRKWTRQNDLISEVSQAAWYEFQAKDSRTKMYAIFDNKTHTIGVCGLTNLDLLNRNAEFSLYIAPAFQRQGYGKKALKTLLSHGFNTYGLEVIWGESFEHNPAAQMFVNVGLRHEGVRRSFYFRDGKFIDAHTYSILRDEWMNCESFPKEQLCMPNCG